MRRLLALLGVFALAWAWVKHRGKPEAPAEIDPRADELRRRLDESRALAEEEPAAEDFTSGETPVDADERREDVHARGRAAIDEMRGEGSEPD
jgi:hypothetical protein